MPNRYGYFMKTLLLLVGLSVALTSRAQAQGENAVYNSSTITGSTAFIDASALCGTAGSSACGVTGSTDVCTIIKTALTNYSSLAGVVVDARGVVPSGIGGQTCAPINPFATIPQTNTSPITVLLPASTISIVTAWTLPNNTRLVGEGSLTVLQGVTNNSVSCCTSGAMIEMGPGQPCPSTPYSGISIEHLKLINGNMGSYGGIDNECAQSSSYVNDVGMSDLKGTGLMIGAGATNSGPYANITYAAASRGGSNTCMGGSSPCVDIETQTRGLHGLTCQGDGTTAGRPGFAGILVNASNNSIEDVHFEAFYDGIQIGNTTSGTIGNILVSNIKGGTSDDCHTQKPPLPGYVTNLVHICGGNPSSGQTKCSNQGATVTDVTILQAANLNAVVGMGNQVPPTSSVQDDVTGTIMFNCTVPECPSPITAGMYILGEQEGVSTEYTRFAITPANPAASYGASTAVPTWGVNNNTSAPSGSCNIPGALYSYTAATTGNQSVYLCTSYTGSLVWTPI